MAPPACTASGRTSANTPIGASMMIHLTRSSIASPSARKNTSKVLRASGALRAIATASSRAKTISGSIAPFAAAAMGLLGMSDVSQLLTVCCWPLDAICPAASAAPAGSDGRAAMLCGNKANTDAASGMTTTATDALSSTKMISDFPPMRPIALTSLAEATPVMSSETTSGMTVMRIAFTHSVPIGAIASAAFASGTLPDALMTIPSRMAAMSATRTRLLSFI